MARIRTRTELSPDEVNVAAQYCLATQDALLATPGYVGSTTPCLSYALYFPGANAGAAAVHDRDTILAHPKLALLTYMSTEAKKRSGLARRWYNAEESYPEYKGICKPRREARGVQCDEYPYYATVQGGPPDADLREVLTTYNTSEGSTRGAMYNDRKCVMAVDAAGVRSHPGSTVTPFLVIPLAIETTAVVKKKTTTQYSGPRTFHICGDPRTIPGDAGGGGGVSVSS